MMTEEWPIAAPAADPQVERARASAADRLSTVRRDFFLNPAARLTEQERAVMRTMLDDLLATIADEVLAGLPHGLVPSGGEGHARMIAALGSCDLLDRPVLVSLLLRAADEQRLAGALRPRVNPPSPSLLDRWVADADGQLAAAAMALVIARGRRRDRFGQQRLLFDDLPGEEAVALAYIMAAALRIRLARAPASDRALAASAGRLLSRHDEGMRLDAQVGALIRVLESAERLNDALIGQVLIEGDVALLSAMLARRAGVPQDLAWDHIMAGADGRLVLLARLAGVARDCAARLLAELGTLVGIADPAGELAAFDGLSPDQVEDARGEWRLAPAFRAARVALDG